MRPTLIAAVLVAGLAALATSATDARADAKESYDARCAFCHGATGAGDGMAAATLQPPPTNFKRPDYWKTATDERMRETITNGKPGTAMMPFGSSLKPEEISALISYLKTFAAK